MMGGALYVWAAFGLVAAFLVAEVVLLALRRRSILEHLGRLYRGAASRRRRQ